MPRTKGELHANGSGLAIRAVARDLGLSEDLLRKWERRYGFPNPGRNGHGERVYTGAQVERLRLIKRLLDLGMRPSHVIPRGEEDLRTLLHERLPLPAPAEEGLASAMLDLLRNHAVHDLSIALQAEMLRQGLGAFVRTLAIPMTIAVGDAWSRGRLDVFEEHIYTEVMGRILRVGIAAVTTGRGRPRVLLTTLPEERHGLGLLFAAATLSEQGADCLSLGAEMPPEEIVKAVDAQQADILGLSFSSIYPTRLILPALRDLRERLTEGREIWAGGDGIASLPRDSRLQDVCLCTSVEDALHALARWREGDRAQKAR